MTVYALVSQNSPIRLWGLDSAKRLQRQLREIGKQLGGEYRDIRWLASAEERPASGRILMLDGSFLFENRTILGLLGKPGSALQYDDGTVAAAFVESADAGKALAAMGGEAGALDAAVTVMRTTDMAAFDENLRRSTKPMLERVTAERKAELESTLYGNAYRGITDLVTKFVWPRPAKRAVHLCANLHVSPNMVTTFGLALVIAACYLFLEGYYAWGLLAGWLMTFLDTVDGKLARVTIQSSKFGHLYDHIIDLLHPPFWYIYWGMSLAGFQPVLGLGQVEMYWIIVISYIAGRVVEGLFPLLGDCSIFTWRPFDAWFRLVTARRNPCLILLTLSALAGKPAWGFIAVTFWSAFTTALMILRLAQAAVVRMTRGRLSSWLSDEDVANGPHAFSYAVFGATRGAYARK
jgi:phosphatidylglycerophosphate synthase